MPITMKAAWVYTICSVLQQSLSFITVPIFTRLLSTADYGTVSIYSSWRGIVTIFVTLQVPYGTFATAMVKFQEKRDEYTSSIQSFCIISGGIVLLIITIGKSYFEQLFEMPYSIIVIMLLDIVASAWTSCWFARQRFEFKYRPVVAFTLLQSVLMPLVSVILVLHSKEKGYARIIGNAIVIVTMGIVVYILCLKKGKRVYSKKYYRYVLGFNVPLIPYYLSQIIFNSSDRIMISHLRSQSEAGIYSIAYSLGMLLSFVLSAVLNSYQPWLFTKLKSGQASKHQNIPTLMAIGMAILVFGIILVTPEIIFIMAGKAYYQAIWAVPPVAISLYVYFCTNIFLYLDFYYEIKKYMNTATIFAAITNVALNLIIIPKTGFIGASYTTLISYLVFELIVYYAYRKTSRRYGYEQRIYNDKMLFFIQIILLGLGLGIMITYQYLWIRIILVLICFLVFFSKREKIINLYHTIRK